MQKVKLKHNSDNRFAQQAQQEVNLDGGKVEGNETSEPVVDAREKLKRSKGKK